MRIAIAGKGGSGKTTLAGTLARLLGRRGRPVIAIDGDTNPNLAQTLGVPQSDAAALDALPGDLLEKRKDPSCPSKTRSVLAEPVGEVVERYTTAGPDGVRLLLMGRIDHAGAG